MLNELAIRRNAALDLECDREILVIDAPPRHALQTFYVVVFPIEAQPLASIEADVAINVDCRAPAAAVVAYRVGVVNFGDSERRLRHFAQSGPRT